jgi:hypothetical protein
MVKKLLKLQEPWPEILIKLKSQANRPYSASPVGSVRYSIVSAMVKGHFRLENNDLV